MKVKERLSTLRKKMRETKLDAYYVPSVDPHGSEYVPKCWQRRAFISGFSGSAGDILITKNRAGLWTDGRYFIQAEHELKGSGIKLFKMGKPRVLSLEEWIEKNLKKKQILGVDPRVLSKSQAARLQKATQKAGAKLKLVDANLVDLVWGDEQPALPQGEIEVHPAKFAGESVTSKLKRIRKKLAEHQADAIAITTLDAIAWTFNIRGTDVPYNPLVIAYGLISKESAMLFCHKTKVTEKLRKALSPHVQILSYSSYGRELSQLGKEGKTVLVDPSSVNTWVLSKLSRATCKEVDSPINRIKAQKNKKEQEGAKAAHLRDGAAIVRFLIWLDKNVGKKKISEVDASDMLATFRAQGEFFRSESFAPISAYRKNGAIVHYSAEKKSAAKLKAAGLYLIDSGGQYLDGTTDITRTILLGKKATPQEKEHYTRVLKGHIALSSVRFPQGTSGRLIDAFARSALWQKGLDYAHGTGHGVGSYLGVHEGPQAISPTRCTGVPLEEGNILSNEPGFYLEDQYGIRLENLVLVQKDEALSSEGKTFFRFENLTFAPFDRLLIDKKILQDEEIRWINSYHKEVYKKLSPYLKADEKRWLKEKTKPLS